VDYTVTRLSCTPSEQKTIPGTGPEAKPPCPPQFYYQIPLMYNTGTPENRALNDFLLEGCEMDTGAGIQSKPGQSGRVEHSVMCTFDPNNKEQMAFIETMNGIHSGCAYILFAMKGPIKLYNFNIYDNNKQYDAKMTEATGLKNPVYFPRDQMTGNPIQGRKPSMFLKLFSREKAPMVEQTLFTGLDGKPIPWALLQGVEMKFIPLIHVKRIYVGGGKGSIQMEVVSAVVTSIRARNTTTRQTGTIDRLKQARPELPDMVAAQLAKLTTDRQDQMMPPAQQQQGTNDPNQPTFGGIVPTGPRPQIQGQPQMTQQGQLPAIPPLGMPDQQQPAMRDFTANAPTRTPTVNMTQANKAPSPGIPATLQYN